MSERIDDYVDHSADPPEGVVSVQIDGAAFAAALKAETDKRDAEIQRLTATIGRLRGYVNEKDAELRETREALTDTAMTLVEVQAERDKSHRMFEQERDLEVENALLRSENSELREGMARLGRLPRLHTYRSPDRKGIGASLDLGYGPPPIGASVWFGHRVFAVQWRRPR